MRAECKIFAWSNYLSQGVKSVVGKDDLLACRDWWVAVCPFPVHDQDYLLNNGVGQEKIILLRCKVRLGGQDWADKNGYQCRKKTMSKNTEHLFKPIYYCY